MWTTVGLPSPAARRVGRASLFAVLLVGCRQVPIAEGPRIALPVAGHIGAPGQPGSAIRTVSYDDYLAGGAPSNVDVQLHDLRPRWEKEFRSPAVKPSQYEHAIGFVAMENLEPTDELANVVRRVSRRTGMQVARAEIELRSFRVVVHDVDALRHDHRVLTRVGGGGFSLGPFKLGVGASVSSDPVDTGPFADPVAQQKRSFRPALLRDGQKYLFGPPSELPLTAYRAGVTCEIDATVTFVGTHGSRRKFLAQVRQHTPPEDETATATTADLVRTVAAAHADVEKRLVGRIAYDGGQ